MASKWKQIFSALLVSALIMFSIGLNGCNNSSSSAKTGSSHGGGGGGGDDDDGGVRAAITLAVNVIDSTGTPVNGFRWLLEEDTTYAVTPGVQVSDSLSVNIHNIYSPVVAGGSSLTDSAPVPTFDDTRYILTVMADEQGYSLGGSNIAAGQTSVTVQLHEPPIPASQIYVYVFEDNRFINGAPDIPAESGLPGFKIEIMDIMGFQMMDVFGNPLGTEYEQNPDGSFVMVDGAPVVMMMGTGIRTDANGEAIIKNVAHGTYAVTAVPTQGEGWIQTSTIEGTPFDDTWVTAGNPAYMVEGALPGWHVFVGFIKPMVFPAPTGNVGTITGQVVYAHYNRPPIQPGLNPGMPVPDAWIGLSDLLGSDNQVYAQPCDASSNFTINNVPPGTYTMTIWDRSMDAVIDYRTIIVPPEGGLIAMGQVAIFGWYGALEGHVFNDLNGDTMMDMGEMGIGNQAVNIRFPDGSLKYTTVTNPNGYYNFVQVFPFFHWMITEVDYGRYKPTGAKVVVDDGGPLAPGEKLNPQLQPENGNLPYRMDLGVGAILEAMMLYAGETNQIDWGKVAYGPNENGGISGVVVYDTTRGTDDPTWAGQDDWEPGIPRVQVNLYADSDIDGVVDDMDLDGLPTYSDVDNWPFGWQGGGAIGPEDLDRNANTTFDPGDAINVAHTDSFDDSQPTGCVNPPQSVYGNPIKDCAETIQTWNQLRPGVYNGGYIFLSYFPGGIVSGSTEVDGLPKGYYIVEVDPPPAYEVVKEEDMNVVFGEQFMPVKKVLPELSPAIAVGDPHLIPAELSLFPGEPCKFAGQTKPLQDRKLIFLNDRRNAPVNFYLFTPVPISGRFWGMVLNDIALEFDPTSPNMGNNLGVSWLPIAIKDFMGNTVARIYTDEWGRYNAALPSTYSINIPAPSGVSPNAFDICLNDPGPIPDPMNPGDFMIDPWYNPSYAQNCATRHVTPGLTVVADTPILPIGAFSQNKLPLNCEFPDGTPVIANVNSVDGGPYVSSTPKSITITSRGSQTVTNPDYDPSVPLSPKTVIRDFGFGPIAGTAAVGGVALQNVVWAADGSTITGDVPVGALTGELVVTRGDNGTKSVLGITVHVDGPNYSEIIHVNTGGSIQTAIDNALDNALIIVGPGVFKENIIVWHPVKLQGSGAYSTSIMGGPLSIAEQTAWIDKLADLIATAKIDVIPGEQPDFVLENFSALMVNFKDITPYDPNNRPSIDGFQILMTIQGGGIYANAYARYLEISNNKIVSNQGTFGGGIRIGTPTIINNAITGYNGSVNFGISIHNNHVAQNGAVIGGGGLGLFKGTDNYSVSNNFICGNYTLSYGGGIAHFGLSENCSISHNTIFANQSTDEGGGIMVAGELVFAGFALGTLTEGSGSVTIDTNYIIGNLSGDDGGGIRTLMTNGQDIQAAPTNPALWHKISILNNIIADNSSADAGGAISLDDTVNAYIINNTITHNDSTSTSPDSFQAQCTAGDPPGQFCPGGVSPGGGLVTSVPQVGGIHAGAHSAGVKAAFDLSVYQEYANPVLQDNIIYQNRSFYWDAAYNGGIGGLRPDIPGGEPPVFWDLGVNGTATAQFMDPMFCILTSVTEPLTLGGPYSYDPSNLAGNPFFMDGSYFNVYRATSKGAALGNFVMATFQLPTNTGNYHIAAGSPAIDLGGGLYYTDFPLLQFDIDGAARPNGGGIDSGADEL